MNDVSVAQVGTLQFLAKAMTAPGFRHVGDWPPGEHARLADLEQRGLVERKPIPKTAIRKRKPPGPQPAYWRITSAGRAWLSTNNPDDIRVVQKRRPR